MKLDRRFSILILCVASLAGIADSLCLVRNTATRNVYWYQCFKSDDYLADVKKAPIDIPRLTFTNSKARVVKDGSFSRLSQHLERLAFFHCEVEEIEDDAFYGLTKLDLLAFTRNKLRVIKSAWFRGLVNLKTVSFQDNQIKYVEDDFFSIIPPLEALDISNNEISCLPTSTFGNFKADEFNFRHNPLTWMCQALLMNWLKNTEIRNDFLGSQNMDAPYDLTEMCLGKLPKPRLDEDFLNNCIEKTTQEFLPNIAGDYTVKEACEFLKDKPSPFLNCRQLLM
ncbi:reticulon-4 receptor-like 1 [Athalia rosae]|uniref:reticulon-4 receptor-like 1 n=1 Tax=Athalia rosae TaxID=37344 RepID=UPI000626AE49|nr:reticulon-4 receptor-like 1 [Athalia rosae]